MAARQSLKYEFVGKNRNILIIKLPDDRVLWALKTSAIGDTSKDINGAAPLEIVDVTNAPNVASRVALVFGILLLTVQYHRWKPFDVNTGIYKLLYDTDKTGIMYKLFTFAKPRGKQTYRMEIAFGSDDKKLARDDFKTVASKYFAIVQEPYDQPTSNYNRNRSFAWNSIIDGVNKMIALNGTASQLTKDKNVTFDKLTTADFKFADWKTLDDEEVKVENESPEQVIETYKKKTKEYLELQAPLARANYIRTALEKLPDDDRANSVLEAYLDRLTDEKLASGEAQVEFERVEKELRDMETKYPVLNAQRLDRLTIAKRVQESESNHVTSLVNLLKGQAVEESLSAKQTQQELQLRTRIEELERQLSIVQRSGEDSKSTELKQQLEQANQAVQSLQKEQQAAKQRNDALQGTLRTKLVDLQTKNNALETQFSQLNATKAQLEERIKMCESKIQSPSVSAESKSEIASLKAEYETMLNDTRRQLEEKSNALMNSERELQSAKDYQKVLQEGIDERKRLEKKTLTDLGIVRKDLAIAKQEIEALRAGGTQADQQRVQRINDLESEVKRANVDKARVEQEADTLRRQLAAAAAVPPAAVIVPAAARPAAGLVNPLRQAYLDANAAVKRDPGNAAAQAALSRAIVAYFGRP